MKRGKDREIPLIGTLLEAERVTPAAPRQLRARVVSRARRELSQPLPRSSARPKTVRLRFGVAAAVLLAGAGAVASMHGAWRDPPRDPPPATPVVVTVPGRRAPAVAPPAAAAPDVQPPRQPDVGSRFRARDPKVELELLDQAQEAVTARRFQAAMAILEAHARRFPNGSLVEEREALVVRSLSSLGRIAEARQAAAAFRKRFPRSVLGRYAGNTLDAPE